jgi:hypothetical protein
MNMPRSTGQTTATRHPDVRGNAAPRRMRGRFIGALLRSLPQEQLAPQDDAFGFEKESRL